MNISDRDLTPATQQHINKMALGRRDKKAVRSTRRAFTNDECRQIIDSLCANITPELEDSKKWGLLLALYTGLRLDEIANLSNRSVEQVLYSWVIQPETPRGPVAFHIRMIPLHPLLIELGFLTYWQRQVASGHTYLFPELHAANRPVSDHSPGSSIARWFNQKLLVELGISNRSDADAHQRDVLDFHTCRLTVLNTFRVHQVQLHVVRTLLGWGGHDFPIDEQEIVMPVSIAELAAAIRLLNY